MILSDKIEDFEREEALNLLCSLFTSWNSSWNNTAASLSSLNFSESTKRRIHFYETEQKQAILTLLASIFVAWDREDPATFSNSVVNLARELRPSLPYIELEPDESFILSPLDMSRLRSFVERSASLLKNTVSDLKTLSSRRFRFETTPLTNTNAEALLREKLNLPRLDLLDAA